MPVRDSIERIPILLLLADTRYRYHWSAKSGQCQNDVVLVNVLCLGGRRRNDVLLCARWDKHWDSCGVSLTGAFSG